MPTKIRRMMESKGLRQVDLARTTRIDISRLNGYVNGSRFPSALTLARLARALGCKPAELQEVAQ